MALQRVLQANKTEKAQGIGRESGVEPRCSLLGSWGQFSASLHKYTDGCSGMLTLCQNVYKELGDLRILVS